MDKEQLITYKESLYPQYEEVDSNKERFIFAWMKMICTLLTVSIAFCFIIPVYSYIVAGLLCSGLVVQIIRQDRCAKSAKIFLLILNIIGMVLLVDYGDGTLSWSVNYVIPIMLCLVIAGVMAVMVISYKKWERYVPIHFYSLLIVIALNILFFLNISDIQWPSVTALVIGVSTLSLLVGIFRRAYLSSLGGFLHV